MTLSPTHGIAWIDADPIVPHMQHEIVAVRQVYTQETCVRMSFCV